MAGLYRERENMRQLLEHVPRFRCHSRKGKEKYIIDQVMQNKRKFGYYPLSKPYEMVRPADKTRDTLKKEFQSLKKENTELKNRLGKIEVELSKRHIIGIHNLILSNDVIDEIWDEDDDTL